VIPNTGTAISSFTLDGIPLGGFTVHPLDANYSYLRFRLTGGPAGDGRGFHIIHSDSGFNAIAYGFGMVESYSYSAGTNDAAKPPRRSAKQYLFICVNLLVFKI